MTNASSNQAKLVLGTAQLGMKYGRFNKQGRPRISIARKIISVASTLGIDFIDTAANYGESESIIGKTLPKTSKFKIITKIPQLSQIDSARDISFKFNEYLERSLTRLQCKKIHGLLIHHAQDLIGPNKYAVWNCMKSARDRGVVEYIGVSVYDPQEVDAIMSEYDPDIIQLPLNIFDQRFVEDGIAVSLKQAGVSVHARSVYLQGLLLADPSSLSKEFLCVKSLLTQLRDQAVAEGVTMSQLATQFVLSCEGVDKVVVGVETPEQLVPLSFISEKGSNIDRSLFQIKDNAIIDPRQWVVE